MDPPAKKTKKPLRQEVKELRKQLGQKRIGGGLATQHLYVTHCANEPLGAAKKYPRLGPVETMEIQDTSIEGIKAACLHEGVLSPIKVPVPPQTPDPRVPARPGPTPPALAPRVPWLGGKRNGVGKQKVLFV